MTGEYNNDPPKKFVAASALSKIIFKEGRRTIAPTLMIELAEFLPKRERTERTEACWTGTSAQSVNSSVNESGYKSTRKENLCCVKANVCLEIERERRRGLELASLLGKQTVLSEEFRPEEALGRYYDGVGVEGVVSTLAQLGRLSRYQLI